MPKTKSAHYSSLFVRRYVFAILAIIALAIAVVVSLLITAQQRELDIRNQIQFVHLESVSVIAELSREARSLRHQLIDERMVVEFDRHGAADVEVTQIGFSGILSSMQSRMSRLSELDDRGNGEIVRITLERLNRQFTSIQKVLQDPEAEFESSAQIDVLIATIDQLDRLHKIAADRLLSDLTHRHEQRPVFLGLILFCILLTSIAVWVLVRSLIASLERQEAVEDALAESQHRLQHIQKLDALGGLAGGIAHDFNNLLMIILGHVDLLRLSTDGNQRFSKSIDEIGKAVSQGMTLSKQLLAFSRRQPFEPQVLNLNESIHSMEGMLQRVISADIQLSFNYADELFDVELDADQLQQAILNLINNARDAMPDGGSLTVNTESIRLSPKQGEILGIEGGNYSILTVSDSGVGMSEQVQDRIFEPFFTTKDAGQGTGLGLSMIHGFVLGSGGHIFVNSKIGLGTRISIYFPGAETPSKEAADQSTKARLYPGTESILVVEDNEQVRQLIESELSSLGYTVHSAADAKEGLAICKDLAATIDLVLSDVVMPEMSGPQFVSEALALRPDAAAIYMSGYTRDELLRAHYEQGGGDIPLISKPFKIEDLSRTIREQLNRRAAVMSIQA